MSWLAMSEAPDDEIARRMVASAPIGIALLDPELRYLRVNAALAAIHGRTAADHIGRAHADIAPHTATTVEPVLRHVLASGQSRRALEIVVDQTYVATSFRIDGDD